MTQPETPIPANPVSDPSSEKNEAAPSSPAADPGPVQVKLFARTDVGQVREHNEDNFLVADLSKRSRGLLEANRAAQVGPHGSLFAVCDGMGGAAAGEIASQLAVDIIYERMIDALEPGSALNRDDLARRLVRAVEAAGLRIFQEAKADRTRRGMGTTVTAAALVDNHLFFAQVGDSRGYILRGDHLVQVTRDQSLVNQLIEAGQLTEEEAETFEHNNIILQALGTADSVQVDLTYAELRKGDVLLLCSDGLSGMVRYEEIRDVLRTCPEPLDACKQLTERANNAGGHDNITVIIVRFDGEGLVELAPDTEVLKYKKYALPEELSGDPEPTRRTSLSTAMRAAAGRATEAVQAQADNQAAVSVSGAPDAKKEAKKATWHEKGPHGPELEERIDIPGTHVPTWVVVALIFGVMGILGATAFLFLR